MPEHLDQRMRTEAAIVAALAPVFDESRLRVAAGQSPDWNGLRNGTRLALEENLEEMFATAFLLLLMMIDVPDSETIAATARIMGQQYAASTAHDIATNLTKNARQDLESGMTPDIVFGRGRAESIAATETTRVISAGEWAARGRLRDLLDDPRALRAPGERGAQPPQTPAQLPPSVFRGGLVAIWNTEGDARVCPRCGPLDQQREEVWMGDYPFGPPIHPNCRCYLSYEKAL
jgi:hypothetical protein